VRREARKLEQLVDGGLVEVKITRRDARLVCNRVARLRKPGVEP
jgi:hypothetical protein